METVEYCPDFVNAFGEPIQESDVLAAYEQCDKTSEKRVRFKQFSIVCEELNIKNEDDEYKELFDQIDVNGRGYFKIQDLRMFFEDPALESYEFCNNLLGGFMYDSSYTNWQSELALDDIKALINKLDSRWENRVEALQSFARQMLKQKKKTRFCTTITQSAQHLCLQLQDRRTKVSRAACICISKICRKKREWCSHVAPRLLRSLFDFGVRGNVQIAADSAAQCCLAIVKNVPDGRKGDLTHTILEACQDKGYANVRVCAFVLLSQLIHQAVKSKRPPYKKQKAGKWWTSACDVIQQGIKDADKVVRDNAYRCLLQLDHYKPIIGKPIVRKFKRVKMNTYEKIRNSSPIFQLTRQISIQIYDIPHKLHRSSTSRAPQRKQSSSKDKPVLQRASTTHHHTSPRPSRSNREFPLWISSQSQDSSEEKEEDPEDTTDQPLSKKRLHDVDRLDSAVSSADSVSTPSMRNCMSDSSITTTLSVRSSMSDSSKRLPRDSVNSRLESASLLDWSGDPTHGGSARSNLRVQDHLSFKRDIGSPTGHIRQNTKELLKSELEQLRMDLRQSKQQIDSLQEEKTQMTRNEKRIEILQSEFQKMMHITDSLDRKHTSMISEMQRAHEKQLKRIYEQTREESERRIKESIWQIVEAVSASPSIHDARSKLAYIGDTDDTSSVGMRSYSRDRKMSTETSEADHTSYGSIAHSFRKKSHGGGHIPESPIASVHAPVVVRTKSGRGGRLIMEAQDHEMKLGVITFDDVSEDENSEVRRRKSYRKIANPKGGKVIDKQKHRDANISFDFMVEAEGPLMPATSEYFDSMDRNPFASAAPYRLTPRAVKFQEGKGTSFFFNTVE